MNNIRKKVIACMVLATAVLSSSVVASAGCGFGGNIPVWGGDSFGIATKESSSKTFYLTVSKTGSDAEYKFWGYKYSDGLSNRSTTLSSASGTGDKYAYYGSSKAARDLEGEDMSLGAKMGSTEFTSMWIEGEFTP